MAQLPNPFLNSTALAPAAVEDPAVALSRTSTLDAQTDATAEPISQSTLDPATGVDTAAGPEFADPPVPAAEYFDEPTSSTGGLQEAPASAPSKNPDVGVLGTEHIHEIFAGARKLYPPIDIEEIELPLFIRDGDHLRRWTA